MLNNAKKFIIKILNFLSEVPGLKILGKALNKVVEKELESDEGIVNLAFGIIAGLIVILQCIYDILSKIIKTPPIPNYVFLLSFGFLLIYFLWCVKLLRKTENS